MHTYLASRRVRPRYFWPKVLSLSQLIEVAFCLGNDGERERVSAA